MSAEALAVNNGLTPQAYQAKWMSDYTGGKYAASSYDSQGAGSSGLAAGAMDIGKGLVDVAKNYNLNQMEHQAVQYMKAGQQPPPEFSQRLQALRQAGMPKGPITPPGTTTPPQAGPSIMQRGMDMASKMRNFAAQRVLPAAAGAAVPAAVAGAVAAPGAAMMMDAYRNYQTQTPEQRKQSAMEALSGQGMGQAGIY
jgi:hypothetical protein